MKKYKNFLIIIWSIFLLSFFICIFFTSSSRIKRNNILLINDIAETVKENWYSLSELEKLDTKIDYAVFDTKDNIVFKTSNLSIKNLSDAIIKNYQHMAISSNGILLGEVVFINGLEANSEILRKKIIITLSISAFLLLLGMILYGVYVERTIIKPFERMRNFASNIASGNLDVDLPMEKENMFGAFTESFDIMKEELNASKKRETELKKKEKELIASLSHDLKTPITGIKLTSELLKVKVTDEYEREKINNIYQKAQQIDSMVNDLFASTLEELGQMQVNCKDENSQVLFEILKRHDDKNLVTSNEIPNCLVNIDLRRMEQIISNIIRNSYKYANTKITVDFQFSKGYLQMSIRDFGPGVPESEIHLITNKFFRGKSEEVAMQEGSGLGLYISKTLIEKMNGEIICSSENPGFKVTLMIPLS